MIIQKEFDGFSDTNERLDLLALDSNGNIVVIENKLDDSGHDVTWQALKYTSYASSLSKTEIKDIYQQYLTKYQQGKDASEQLENFYGCDYNELQLNVGDQRIILVAAAFRKEVTSTVMWLLDHNIDVKCIKVTPYQLKNQLFLDTDQILPPPDTDEFRISLASKRKEEMKTQEQVAELKSNRLAFWQKALPVIQKETALFLNISPSKDGYLNTTTGVSGILYGVIVTKDSARVELYFDKSNPEANEASFKSLYDQKDSIESVFGQKLNWDPLKNKKACRISYSMNDVHIGNLDEWEKIIRFLSEKMKLLHEAFASPLGKLSSLQH